MKLKYFYETIIEPSAGSDLTDILKEMKALSGSIEMRYLLNLTEKSCRLHLKLMLMTFLNVFREVPTRIV